jgi:long-chain acyl-CoA synthetase
VKSLIEGLPRFGSRKAVGLRGDLGLRWWSYAELHRESRRVAGLLERRRVGPGERILLWAPNGPEWVAVLFGALLRGVITVPIDQGALPETIQQIAAETSARLIFHGHEQDPAFLSLPAQALETLALEPLPDHEVTCSALRPEDVVVIVYTSGTMDVCRGVQLTIGNLDSQIARFRRWRLLLRLIPFRMLVLAPLSHVQGLMLGAFIPLSVGSGVIFVHSVHPAHLLRTIRDNRVTLLSTVPRVLQVLTRALEQQPYGKRGLTLGDRLRNEKRGWMRRHLLFTALNRIVGYRFWVILVGGAALPEYDEQIWRDTGRFVIQGYGLTETAAIVALNGPFSRRVGSIGKPLKHIRVRIAEDGEILVRGANVTPGYFSPGHSESLPTSDGYLPTGDLVREEAGRLYFVGRKKEVIVTSEGFNVSPSDIEAALNHAPGVADAVVLGRKRNGFEEVHAVLLMLPEGDPAKAVAHANGHLAAHQLIRSWTRWLEPEFPRTALMKVRRSEVARRIETAEQCSSAGSIANAAPPVSLEEIAAEGNRLRRIEMLARFIAEAPKSDLQNCQMRLGGNLGLGSLDTVELLAALERRQSRIFDHTRLPQEPTIADVARAVDSAGGGCSSESRLPFGQPWWAGTWPARSLRRITRPAVVYFWSHFSRRCSVVWKTVPANLEPPFLLAAAPHRHWLDAFAVCAVLPEKWASRLMIVTNRDFSEYFAASPNTPWRERLTVAFGYYLGLPLTFPFTIVPHHGSTRSGLLETTTMIDHGCCPLVFPKGILFGKIDPLRHDPGMAMVAVQCGVPVVPVWLNGTEGLRWRPAADRRVQVVIGEPIRVQTHHTPEQIIALLESRWAELAANQES